MLNSDFDLHTLFKKNLNLTSAARILRRRSARQRILHFSCLGPICLDKKNNKKSKYANQNLLMHVYETFFRKSKLLCKSQMNAESRVSLHVVVSHWQRWAVSLYICRLSQFLCIYIYIYVSAILLHRYRFYSLRMHCVSVSS